MSRTIRIVNYAVNGTGVGHLTRLIAINRWIRRYAAHANVRAEIYFLTSSEADSLLFHERFASFKLPSKTVVGESGIDHLAYLALAKQWVWHSLGLLRPDLLIVDTFPRGAFGELLSALDLCRTKAFVYRPSKASVSEKPDFQAMLPLYDAIVVPGNEDTDAVVVPESVRSRLHYTGPIALREPVELWARDEARRQLGVPDGRLAIYVTSGGGGDRESETLLTETVQALCADPSLHVVVGAGPLYRGRRAFSERVTWLSDGGMAELMSAFDLAISAAGYNTFTELMLAGVPTIFLPLEKGADDQRARAHRAVQGGAAQLLERWSGDAIRTAIDTWRDASKRATAAKAARALVPRNRARDAAAELLRLVVPPSEVDAAHEAIDDALLGALAELDVDFSDALTVIEAIEPHRPGTRPREAAEASELAVEMLRHIASRGLPADAAIKTVQAIGRRLPISPPAERADAIRVLLSALVPFDDWAGALMILKVLGAEREMAAAEFASKLSSFLTGLHTRGESLYQGMARLSGAQRGAVQPPSNRELFAAALETA